MFEVRYCQGDRICVAKTVTSLMQAQTIGRGIYNDNPSLTVYVVRSGSTAAIFMWSAGLKATYKSSFHDFRAETAWAAAA